MTPVAWEGRELGPEQAGATVVSCLRET